MSEATLWFLTRSRSGTWRSHVGLSAVLLFMCWQFSRPPATFPLSSSHAAFEAITPDESLWALFFGATGLLGLAGAMPVLDRFYSLRVASCAILAMVHAMIGGLFWMGSPASIGSGTFLLWGSIALGNLLWEPRECPPS